MKKIIGFVKANYLYINFAILTLLLFLSCFFEPCVYVTVAFSILVSIFLKFENVMQMILFTLPFELAFELKSHFPIYTLLWLMLTFVVGVKYIIELFKKKKKINWKTLIPIVLFLIFLIIPIHETRIVAFATYVGIFAIMYLFFEYRKEISLKKLVLSLIFAIIVSSIFYLTKFASPRIGQLFPVVYPIEKCNFVRFSALTGHPNVLGIYCIISTTFLFALFYKKQLPLWQFILIFVGLFVPAYLALSRDFVIAFAVLFVLFIILNILRYKKKSLCSIGCLALVMIIVMSCCFYPTKIYLVRFNILPNNFNDEIVEVVKPINPGDVSENLPEYKSKEWWDLVYEGEIGYDPGREGIWQMYLTNWKSSIKTILVGRGISAKYVGQIAAHNTFIQLLWQHGLIGCLLLIVVLLSFISLKGIKNNILLLLLTLAPIFVCSFVETLTALHLLVIFILIITNKEKSFSISYDTIETKT